MIKKILEICSIGRFANYHLKTNGKWDGSFAQINVIYAPNGSGKTTLSTILKSLAQSDSELIQLKKTFDSQLLQSVKILSDSNGIIKLENDVWSAHNLAIEALDVLFIEDYLFAGSVLSGKNKLNLFKILLGDQGRELNDKYKALKSKFIKCHEAKRYQRKVGQEPIQLEEPIDSNLSEFKRKKQNRLKRLMSKDDFDLYFSQVKQDLKAVEEEIQGKSNVIFSQYIQSANEFLSKFAPYIKFDRFQFEPTNDNSKKLRLKFIIEVHGQKIEFAEPVLNKNILTVKHTLSEGDKSAVALCFFLARLNVLGYKDKIIVFDDPLSSFDYGRRLTTINTLAKIATNCKQFFLLTHDLHFAKDFSDKLGFAGAINFKIENNGTTSLISPHNIHLDTLTSGQKDFQTVSNYLKLDASSDIERREVVRCIRPILEGALRSKYFDLILSNEWLGDMIMKIKNSTQDSRLFKLQPLLDDIVELNDYSRGFHHANNSNASDTINPFELRKYIGLLMATVDRI